MSRGAEFRPDSPPSRSNLRSPGSRSASS